MAAPAAQATLAEPDAAPPGPVPRQRGESRALYTWWGVWGVRVAVFALLMVSWELYGQSVSRALFAPPSAIARSFRELYIDENIMLPALWTSFGSLLLGFLSAIVAGVLIGLAMGRVRMVEWLLTPYVTFVFSIPYIALIPLLVIWFGVEWKLRVVLVFLASLFPVIINTLAGVKEVDEDLVDVARSNCATERQLMWTVILPGTLPYIFSGVQVGLGLALVGVVVAEMTAAVTGVGGLIVTYANFFRTADLFVPIVSLMVVSVALNRLMHRLEGVLMPWQSHDD